MKKLSILLVSVACPFLLRSQIRDNAGLRGDAGAVSGFFETSNPQNYPSGASSWWHLLDTRHSNTINNYAMQFAGSFFDQNLFFRKTNENAAQPWSRVLLERSGKVGIGTINPTANLEVLGDSNGGQLTLSRNYLAGEQGPGMTFKNIVNTGVLEEIASLEANLVSGSEGAVAGSLKFNTVFNSTKINVMTLSPTGNVGIGTASPNEKLAVNGSIRAKEVKVENSNWPDYVFERDYKILGLDELERYIK